MTGLCPFARHRLIPPGANDPAIVPRAAILHVDAGNADSLYEFFRDRSGGVESHFFVKKTGELEQYRDIYVQADANLDANDFAVSIETQGFGAGEWNAEQLFTIQKLLTWLRDEAGIPLVKCPTWDGSGVGYHTMFGSPSHWTPVAKSCPGPDRIRQFHDLLVPWMKTTHSAERPPPRPKPPEGKPMNRVEQAHKLAGQALKLQAEANALLREVKDRPQVAKMETKWTAGWHIIADAKADGPPK